MTRCFNQNAPEVSGPTRALLHHDLNSSERGSSCLLIFFLRFDLSYTPPLSSPWDPVQTAGQVWLRSAAGSR